MIIIIIIIIIIRVVVDETKGNRLSLTDRDTEEGARYRGSSDERQQTVKATNHLAFHLTAVRELGFCLISPPSHGLHLFPHAIVQLVFPSHVTRIMAHIFYTSPQLKIDASESSASL
jgi:hypothetical protein